MSQVSELVTPAPAEALSIWATLNEAVRGSRQDFTRAPIGRSIVLLAVPMVLEMLMESVFAVADVFFVGRLGADAVATVRMTESLMTVIYAVAIGLSIGASATVARRIGEGQVHRRPHTYTSPVFQRPAGHLGATRYGGQVPWLGSRSSRHDCTASESWRARPELNRRPPA